MSKLDEVQYEIYSATRPKHPDGSEMAITPKTRQQIKDLMLKIVDTAYSEKHEDSPHATEMWHEICNEIKQL